MMKCPTCKNGNTIQGQTALVFEKGHSTIILKKVPADLCDNCNEAFVDEETSKRVFAIVNIELKKEIEVEILNYAA